MTKDLENSISVENFPDFFPKENPFKYENGKISDHILRKYSPGFVEHEEFKLGTEEPFHLWGDVDKLNRYSEYLGVLLSTHSYPGSKSLQGYRNCVHLKDKVSVYLVDLTNSKN